MGIGNLAEFLLCLMADSTWKLKKVALVGWANIGLSLRYC